MNSFPYLPLNDLIPPFQPNLIGHFKNASTFMQNSLVKAIIGKSQSLVVHSDETEFLTTSLSHILTHLPRNKSKIKGS